MEKNKFDWFDEEASKKVTEEAKEVLKDLKKTWNDLLELLKIE